MSARKILAASVLALGAAALVPVAAAADWGRSHGDMRGMQMQRMGGDHGGARGGDRMGGAGGPLAGPAFDFAAIDADGDGKLTEAELSAHRAAEVAKLDADGDGFVSAEELAARTRAQFEERMQARAAQMLERFDADGDGKVAVGELPDGGLGQRMFAAIDGDGDGAITEAEIAAAKAEFDRMGPRGGQGRGDGSRGMRGFH